LVSRIIVLGITHFPSVGGREYPLYLDYRISANGAADFTSGVCAETSLVFDKFLQMFCDCFRH